MVIFKTINIINNKYYIGKDTKNCKSYFGSGIAIKKAIRKYGKQNFIKEILYYCRDLKELNEKEKEYVNEKVVNDSMSYNLTLGGQGGDLSKFVKRHPAKGIGYKQLFINKFGEEEGLKRYNDFKDKKSESVKGSKNGMYHSEKTKGEKNGMFGKRGILNSLYGKPGHKPWNKGQKGLYKCSDETKRKMSLTRKNLKRNYYIQQIDNNGNILNEFKTIIEAVETLKISKKKAYANSFKEFLFKKIYR